MTPKEKAETMVLKYTILINYDFVSDLKFNNPNDEDRNRRVKKDAKKCAFAAVDELIKSEPRYPSNVDWDDVGGTHKYYYEAQIDEAKKYWQEVKQEIEKL